jgi:hypothetical protein
MQCDKCRNDAVFFQSYSGRHLCDRHLALDIETRAKRSIRLHHWMRPGDHIAVVVSGDRHSAALLCFLKVLTADRRDIRLSAVPAGGENTGTRGGSFAAEVAESLRIPCIGMPPPNCSGTLAPGGVTKIALAISLDDMAQGVLEQFLFGSVGRLMHSPPDTGRIPVIYPFIAVPAEELDMYWRIRGTGMELPPGRPGGSALARETRAQFEDYYRRHPATKYALLHIAEALSGDGVTAMLAAGTGPDGSPGRGDYGEVHEDGS